MQFWQFYWSNIVDGQNQEKEFDALYNINKEIKHKSYISTI